MGVAISEAFGRFAKGSARAAGSPVTFALAGLIILAWGLTGPVFHYSDTWQLVINTATTIVTFLMVFLIQNTQNRDALAMHIKLDELIRAVQGARNRMVDLEDLSVEELDALKTRFASLAQQARQTLTDTNGRTGGPAMPEEEAR
jgi:low affinity Fe/Cu permease